MLSQEAISAYRGAIYERGDNYAYVPVHPLLQPYISNYTITFPTPAAMPDAYTVLPSASSTLTMGFDGRGIVGGLRGVNTKASCVGLHANKMHMLLLIEFRPGGLYPFMPMDQHELLDSSFELSTLNRTLFGALEIAVTESDSVSSLIAAVDRIFLAYLRGDRHDDRVGAIARNILLRHGNIGMKEISREIFYSEKHMRRLFMQHIGASPKAFARIARVNYALRLLTTQGVRSADVAAETGYYDQSHFIRDFRQVCGVSPQEYLRNASLFYNDYFNM